MAIILRPLFGLTCTGEAMPEGSEADCAAALAEAAPLRAAMERLPAPVLTQAPVPAPPPPTLDHTPMPVPTYGPGGPR